MKSTILSLILAAAPLGAEAAEKYDFTDKNQRNTASIMLDAPFESIMGVANAVEGAVTVDANKASGAFKVRVDSIKTGNDTRDGHLQNDKWLDAKKFPYIEFSFKDVPLPADFKAGKPITVAAKGELSLHGVKKPRPITVKLQYFPQSELTKSRLPGNLVRVKSDFDVKLTDHNVAQSDSGVKALIGLKVGEVAKVSIDFFGTDAK